MWLKHVNLTKHIFLKKNINYLKNEVELNDSGLSAEGYFFNNNKMDSLFWCLHPKLEFNERDKSLCFHFM